MPLRPFTVQGRSRAQVRMALLSGEVETLQSAAAVAPGSPAFRMALLSGEVETMVPRSTSPQAAAFRMALLSGEVET